MPSTIIKADGLGFSFKKNTGKKLRKKERYKQRVIDFFSFLVTHEITNQILWDE